MPVIESDGGQHLSDCATLDYEPSASGDASDSTAANAVAMSDPAGHVRYRFDQTISLTSDYLKRCGVNRESSDAFAMQVVSEQFCDYDVDASEATLRCIELAVDAVSEGTLRVDSGSAAAPKPRRIPMTPTANPRRIAVLRSSWWIRKANSLRLRFPIASHQ